MGDTIKLLGMSVVQTDGSPPCAVINWTRSELMMRLPMLYKTSHTSQLTFTTGALRRSTNRSTIPIEVCNPSAMDINQLLAVEAWIGYSFPSLSTERILVCCRARSFPLQCDSMNIPVHIAMAPISVHSMLETKIKSQQNYILILP